MDPATPEKYDCENARGGELQQSHQRIRLQVGSNYNFRFRKRHSQRRFSDVMMK